MARKLRVGIIFGGRSAEHEISLQSARNIVNAADPGKYEIVPVGITKEGQWRAGFPPGGSVGSSTLEAVLNNGQEVLPAVSPQGGTQLVPVGGPGAKEALAGWT